MKMVRVGRLELPASCSQSKRATNCATPGYEVFQLWSNMGSAPVFDQFPARGKTPSALASQSFPGFWRSAARTPASRSQSWRATNCAIPGYFIFLHDTMRRKKKQVFRVCGRRCGQAQFYGNFSTGEFPPQATVPRTSGISLSREWIGHLSSQITCVSNRTAPVRRLFNQRGRTSPKQTCLNSIVYFEKDCKRSVGYVKIFSQQNREVTQHAHEKETESGTADGALRPVFN